MVEEDVVEYLNNLIGYIRNTEAEITKTDYKDKTELVLKLVDLESSVKQIRDTIEVPELNITEDTSIRDLQKRKLLSVRASNLLRRNGCDTVSDVLSHNLSEISVMRGMGQKSLCEIQKAFEEFGFSIPNSKPIFNICPPLESFNNNP